MSAVASRIQPISVWSAVLLGAAVSAVLSLLFWATAAAQGLTDQAPPWLRTFQPSAGVETLVFGLLWSALLGGAVIGLCAVCINVMRKNVRVA